MRKLLLSLFALIVLSMVSAKAQLITTSQGIVREHIETIEPEPEPEPIKPPKNYLRTGFQSHISAFAGLDYFDAYMFGINISYGYMVVPSYLYAGVGFGLGVNMYEYRNGYYNDDHDYVVKYYDETDIHLPLFGHLRYNMLNKKTTPFVDLKIGYAVGSDLMVLEPGLGLTYVDNLSYKVSFCFVGDWSPGMLIEFDFTF